MFENYYKKDAILPFINDYNFFHPISDREYWDKMCVPLKPYADVIKKTFDNYVFEPLYATMYRQFVTEKNREKFESKYFDRRCALIGYTIAEAIENKGEYTEKIMDLIWMILEEASWCLPAHARNRASYDSLPDTDEPCLDLFAAETATALSFAYSVMKEKLDRLSANVCKSIVKQVNKRVLDAYMNVDDWWWIALHGENVNNWNPWINSNILASTLAIEPSHERRAAVIARVLRSVDSYLSSMPQDGACDEGPGYWMYAGLKVLDIIYYTKNATGGRINFYGEQKIKNIAEYVVKAQIFDGYITNFADSPAIINMARKSGQLYRHGFELESDAMMSLARMSFEKVNLPRENGAEIDSVLRTISDGRYLTTDKIFYGEEFYNIAAHGREFSYIPDCMLESIHYMVSRQSTNSSDGLYIAAKGGHNGENHNHNDVGNFIIYKDGAPFIVDAGSLVYSALTFVRKTRYTLWQNVSNYHNLPTIGGFNQLDGAEYAAKDVSYSCDGKRTFFSVDISRAYKNRDEIEKWLRTIDFDKQNGTIEITENFSFADKKSIVLNFLSASPAMLEGGKIIIKAANGAVLEMIPQIPDFDFATENIFHEDDTNFRKSWGGKLYKFTLTLKDKFQSGKMSYVFR